MAPVAATCTSLPVRPKVVNQLPAISLPCLGPGGSVTLNHVQPPLVVNLWASWCYPCQQEMPRLQAAYAAQHGRLPFLGVATQDTAKAAASFAAHVGARYPDVLDSQGLLARQLGAVGLPVTLVLDAQGRIVYRHAGELFPPDIRAALAAAGVAAASPATPVTPKGSPS